VIFYLAKTLTTPSPPALTTHRPSWLQTTEHTPSPRMMRWLVISCVQLLLSRDQKRRLASWPAETSSRPSGERDKEDMAEGCASMVYVHWPVSVSMSMRRRSSRGGGHTAVGVEEPDITILVTRNDYTLNSTSRASSTVNHCFVF
jgi:hypothetical protein